MVENTFENQIYSKNVIEFITVANEYCAFVEKSVNFSKKDFVEKLQKLLPLIYLKATLLPKVETVCEDEIEKFVTESDWNFVYSGIKSKLGDSDTFIEILDPMAAEVDEPIASNISENCADIYQDLKDLITTYKVCNNDSMNDALADCISNFEEYWGQRLVNTLRAIHFVKYNTDFDEENENIENNDVNKIF